jgi:SAM-dependent methyltransferase
MPAIQRPKLRDLIPSRDEFRRSLGPIARGSLLGFLIGIIPGSAHIISSFVSYGVERRLAKSPERFGKGAIEGVAGPESANNAAASGAFVPMMALGIPTSPITAVMIAAIMVHGVLPGPLLIQQQPELFWGFVASMYVGNVVLLILNLPMVGVFVNLLRIPYSYLYPCILCFCILGTYSVNNSIIDVWILLVMGAVGYALRKFGYDLAPVALGLVLAPMLELSLRQSLSTAFSSSDPSRLRCLRSDSSSSSSPSSRLCSRGRRTGARLWASRKRATSLKRGGRVAWAAALLCAAVASADENLQTGGPYVPTPHDVVDAMLTLAGVGPQDMVVDLGCGDGRIVLAAVQKYQAQGVGVDIDRGLVDDANATARGLGVAARARFIQQDVMDADLSRATVVALYLLPEMMKNLRFKLLQELKPGTRIVSHDFDLGDWPPDRTVDLESTEKFEIVGDSAATVYLWIVPAAVAGTWTDDTGAFRLEIRQRYQGIAGTLTRDGRTVALRDARINGAQIRFTAPARDGAGQVTYTGTVENGRMTGEVTGTVPARWSAARVR